MLQKDFDAQMAKFRNANDGRNPSTAELVKADIAAMSKDWHSAMEDMAENMAVILALAPYCADEEDDGRGDMNDDNKSIAGDESPSPLPAAGLHGAGLGRHGPRKYSVFSSLYGS